MNKDKFLMIFILLILIFGLGEAASLSMNVHVAEKYITVSPGDRIYFEIDIKYPENLKRKDLRLSYDIFDEKGKRVSSSQVLVAVETQISLIDFAIIPEGAKPGIYRIEIEVKDYESLSEKISTSFEVVSEFGQAQWYFFILFSMVLLTMFLVILGIRSRRK